MFFSDLTHELQNQALARASRKVEHLVRSLLDSPGAPRIIAGPWLGEVGWELLYWIPLLRWAVSRWPELRQRLVIVSRGGVANWYEGVSDTYVDVGEAYDAATYLDLLNQERGSRQSRGGHYNKQGQETEWEREIISRIRERFGSSRLPVLPPSITYRTRNLAHALWDSDAFAPLSRPSLGRLQGLLPERYVAVRFYHNKDTLSGPAGAEFARAACDALGESIPVVSLDPGMMLDSDHPEFDPGSSVIPLAPHVGAFKDNLAMQSAVIAHATAFVGTFGGFSYIAPHYGVPSVCFWSVPELKTSPRQHIELATSIYNRPGWGGYTARSCHQASMEDLIAPVLAAVLRTTGCH